MSAGHLQPSGDLQWLLLKGGNSFTHKRVGAGRVFSTEKGNVANIHAFKYSGLSNARTLAIAENPAEFGLTLTHRSAKDSNRFSVKQGLKVQNVKGRGGRKVAGIVAELSGDADGRLDLLKLSLARTSALLRKQTLQSQAGAKSQKVRSLRGQALIRSKAPKVAAKTKAPKAAKVDTMDVDDIDDEAPELVEA